MELSKFMKHKEREVVTLLTRILGGGKVFIFGSHIVLTASRKLIVEFLKNL